MNINEAELKCNNLLRERHVFIWSYMNSRATCVKYTNKQMMNKYKAYTKEINDLMLEHDIPSPELEWSDICDLLMGKYNINTHDYNNSHNHYPIYLEIVGETSPKNNDVEGQKRSYQKYLGWCINNPEPEYLNFWHYLTELREVKNGNLYWLNYHHTGEKWKDRTIELIFKEFKDHIKKNNIKFRTSW